MSLSTLTIKCPLNVEYSLWWCGCGVVGVEDGMVVCLMEGEEGKEEREREN